MAKDFLIALDDTLPINRFIESLAGCLAVHANNSVANLLTRKSQEAPCVQLGLFQFSPNSPYSYGPVSQVSVSYSPIYGL